MTKVAVPQDQLTELLTDSVAFMKEAGPKLEKLSQYDEGLEKFAKDAATKMAEAGLVKAEDVDALATEIQQGGIDKVAEAFDFVVRNVGTPTLGKTASHETSPPTREKTADEVWNEGFGITVPQGS